MMPCTPGQVTLEWLVQRTQFPKSLISYNPWME